MKNFVGKFGDISERESLLFFLTYPLTDGGKGCVRGGSKGRRVKMKKRGRKGKGKVKMQRIPLLWLHFSFSPTLLFLHTLKSLKEKCQTFRTHRSKKIHCQLWFSTQTPF